MTAPASLASQPAVANPAWQPAELAAIGTHFEAKRPEDVLRWASAHFAPDLALATGFGPEGVVLMHVLAQVAPETEVFYLDTGLLFPETYALRDELAARLGLKFTRVSTELSLKAQAERHGPALWTRDPDRCCYLRKVEPLRRHLAGKRAWITAIRRDQTRQRAQAGIVEWDAANGLVKINPLAAWTKSDVWAYIHIYELPVNRLHQQGYPSIGCWPCTQAVAAGEDDRAGRWAGRGKTECGIHLPRPGAQAAQPGKHSRSAP